MQSQGYSCEKGASDTSCILPTEVLDLLIISVVVNLKCHFIPLNSGVRADIH
jgi:hypothetical protein